MSDKSPVTSLFNEWLTLMERAYEMLSAKQFRELEEKIKYEIKYHRRKP